MMFPINSKILLPPGDYVTNLLTFLMQINETFRLKISADYINAI